MCVCVCVCMCTCIYIYYHNICIADNITRLIVIYFKVYLCKVGYIVII